MAGAASRFAGSSGVSLRFPKEVGTDEVPNYITFRPTVVDFGTYQSGKGLKESYGNAFNFNQKSRVQRGGSFSIGNQNLSLIGSRRDPFAQIKSQVGGIFDNLSNGVNALLGGLSDPFKNFSYTHDISLFGGLFEGRVNLGGLNLDPQLRTSATTLTKLAGVNLYLPPELSHSLQANYAQQDLGGLGSAAVNALDQGFYFNENGGSYGGAAIDTAGSVISGLINDVTKDGVLGTAFQRSTGRVSNNYSFTIFKGMQHRKFSYSFRLIARNANDSVVIKDICDTFMFYMLPVRSTDSFHHFDIPCMWEIGYNRYGKPIELLDQPNNCFLENVSISYGKDGLGQTYNNGAPVDVTIKLSFMEIEPLVRTDGDIRKTETLLSQFDLGKKREDDYITSSGAG